MPDTKRTSEYKEGLKDVILDTAMTLFVTNGIKAVRMDDIAAKLSISKRTLYEIYGTKCDLLLECIKKFTQYEIGLFEDIGNTGKDVIEIIMRSYKLKLEQSKFVNPMFYEDIDKYPKIMEYLSQDNDIKQARFISFIKRGVAEGYFRSDLNINLVGIMFESMPDFIKRNKLHATYTLPEIFHNIVFLAVRGLCTTKGLDAIDNYDLNS